MIGISIASGMKAPAAALSGPQVGGPHSPSQVVEDELDGSIHWTNPENAEASDDTYTVSGTVTSIDPQTLFLAATGFGFTIPDQADINGVLVEVECKCGSVGRLSEAALVIAGEIVIGTAPSDTNVLPQTITSTESYRLLGSAVDRWGSTLRPVDVSDPGFGVAIAFRRTALNTAFSVDHIRITIYYTV